MSGGGGDLTVHCKFNVIGVLWYPASSCWSRGLDAPGVDNALWWQHAPYRAPSSGR